MKHLSLMTWAILALATPAAASGPSIAVTLARLQPGNLPRVVTIYGTIGSPAPDRRLLMAPLPASVTDVYVQQGQRVAKDAPLVRLAPSPASAAAYDRAKSALHVAVQLVARTRAMVRVHLATDQQLFEAEKAEADARSGLAALTAQGAGGPLILRAPADAIVAKTDTAPGAIVAEGAPLVELAQPKGLVLKAGAVPNTARAIRPDDPVRLTPIGGGPVARGTVLFRAALVDPANGLVAVYISAPADRPLLGEMYRADITIGSAHGYVVPHRAVLVDSQGATYVVQARHLTAHRVPVRVLAEQGDKDAIAGHLAPQDPVVIDGNYQAREGSRLRLASARPGKPE